MASRVNNCIAFTNNSGDLVGYLVKLQDAGAIAILLGDGLSRYAGTYDITNPSGASRVKIPVVQIGSVDSERIWTWWRQYNSSLRIEIGAGGQDRNLFQEVRQLVVWYVVQVIMACFSGGCIILAVYKLVSFIRFRGWEVGVPQICLFWECLGNLFRLVYWAVDPIFLLRGLFSFAAANFMLSIHVPMYILFILSFTFFVRSCNRRDATAQKLVLRKSRAFMVFVDVICLYLHMWHPLFACLYIGTSC